jgi:hypothetical protein
MTRIGIYGWGVVAPRSPDVAAFAANLEKSDSWLAPFSGPDRSNFLAGSPEFDLSTYRPWIDARFTPTKFAQLRQKMGFTTQYAIGAFIQSLGQNPGIEATLQSLGDEAQVLVSTGLGDLPTYYDCSVALYRARRQWEEFWAQPQRNTDRDTFDSGSSDRRDELRGPWGVPARPEEIDDPIARDDAAEAWNHFWAGRSDGLAAFLERLNAIEAQGVQGEVEQGKLRLLRRKRTETERLQREVGCPTPPWLAVSANLLWNIPNTAASQVSMLGRITGAAYAPVAACSGFGVALHLAIQAIRTGEAKAVVVGATDPPPHMLSVGTFYKARVLASDRAPSVPLTDFRGTHVAGGACVWIVGDRAFMEGEGFSPLGLEILGVGVTSDADHIITPSTEGPRGSIRRALEDAGVSADEITNWDLHATATPGDYQEVRNLSAMVRDGVVVTARKGTFGHGMSCGGGWELLAQHLGLAEGRIHPTPLTAEQLNPSVQSAPLRYVLDEGCAAEPGAAGKLSMGVGGINACVISRPWDTAV